MENIDRLLTSRKKQTVGSEISIYFSKTAKYYVKLTDVR